MKKIAIVSVLSLLMFGQAHAATSNQLTSQTDKFSYVVGLNLGKNFKAQGAEVNPKQLLKGLQDGLRGAKPMLSAAQQQEVMQTYQKAMMAQMQAKNKAAAGVNLAAGEKFLAANAKKAGVKTTKDGLQYKVLTSGKGDSPSATDAVTVDYEGKLINGKVFDSSYKRGQPATFKVNQVIPGWTQALQMMKPGATWMLYIPANLAYGNTPMGDVIPAGSTLVFKVHLISVKK
jgi:FKBP-type peptidyl-prolyl cis-trans isomerase FklB